ncbi:hypothetical protein G3I31_17425 [Streptomyces sp. SID9913]|uniref:hypothetical protein n=1 Tax=Streptomyces sp. SID9913 TaxID=2706117 RepID=UPI0013DCFD2E|nr:hypothetical protein [Streptomyces sp. SID9913]MBM7087040.1 hypothetical protein [Streptomyces sp. S12]NED19862.1 hypothetical protein [Streptomyces sp. SID9913]
MLLFHATCAVLEFSVGLLAQDRLGFVGLVLVCTGAVAVRARHDGLAVGAAVVFTCLLLQA